MLSIQKILAPIDFSDRSSVAAQHAVAMAMHFNSSLIFAHVIESAPDEHRAMTLGHAFEEPVDFHAALQTKLSAFAAATAAGQPYETVVLEGDPARRLEVLARDKGVDFVVMPTHGYGAFRRFLVGSTTAKLIHDLQCPVLTGVHLADHPPFRFGPYRTVVCALGLFDLDHSEQVLRWAADFAKEWSARLHIVHVPPAVDWGAGEWFPPDTQALLRTASRERLVKLMEKIGCEAQVHVEGLDPIEYVNEVIEDAAADVLVVGRSVGHGMIRSNAYSMIRAAACPVISV